MANRKNNLNKNIIRVHPKFRKWLYTFNRELEQSFDKKVYITDTSKILVDIFEEERLLERLKRKRPKL